MINKYDIFNSKSFDKNTAKYDPQQEPPRVLYLSHNGCDNGQCDTESFDMQSYCIYESFRNSGEYSTCCLDYVPSTLPYVAFYSFFVIIILVY